MDFRDKEYLDRLMNLTVENNIILHKLQRSAKLARYGRILYFVVIIGISIGAFYYLQPIVDALLKFAGLDGTALKDFFTSYGTP